LAALLLTSPYWLFREFSRSDSEQLPTWMGAARARKRRLAVILGVLALVVGTLVCVGALSEPVESVRPPEIAPELCDRVQVGMSAAEVRKALGAPPGFYEGATSFGTDEPLFGSKGSEAWIGQQGALLVLYNQDGKVARVVWCPPKPFKPFWTK
jgi:hypothetical protein